MKQFLSKYINNRNYRNYIAYFLSCCAVLLLSYSILIWFNAKETWIALAGIELSLFAAIFQVEAQKAENKIQKVQDIQREEFYQKISQLETKIDKVFDYTNLCIKELKESVDLELDNLIRDRDKIDNELKTRVEIAHVYLSTHLNEEIHSGFRHTYQDIISRLAYAEANIININQLLELKLSITELVNDIESIKNK